MKGCSQTTTKFPSRFAATSARPLATVTSPILELSPRGEPHAPPDGMWLASTIGAPRGA